MILEQNEKLISALREIDTTIIEATDEEGSYTDPFGKTHEELPALVRVALHAVPGEGSNICHELWLPKNWNGCFLGTGNGGMAGKLEYHTLAAYAKGGYAVINTDLGTSEGITCGVNNPDVWKDFGWRATYLMTRAGKLVTEAYYGRPIEHAYFIGGSTGGQQALCMAQRFPLEYAGIIATVPAHNRTHLHTYLLWSSTQVKQSGLGVFPTETLQEITRCAVEYSRATGCSEPEDTFVARPCNDPAYIDGFIAYLEENLPSLSAEHRALLSKLYHGPKNPRTGEQLYCGLPIGAEAWGAAGRFELSNWGKKLAPRLYPFQWAFGMDYTGDEFDFDADLDRINAMFAPDMNANDPDLRPFFAAGGKLLFYSGSCDPIVPFPEAVKYYQRVCEMLGTETALSGARYFLIPGQDHGANPAKFAPCPVNGGRAAESPIALLRLWCEEGIAPDSLTVTTDLGDKQGKKTIYAYGTAENPLRPITACDERYLSI